MKTIKRIEYKNESSHTQFFAMPISDDEETLVITIRDGSVTIQGGSKEPPKSLRDRAYEAGLERYSEVLERNEFNQTTKALKAVCDVYDAELSAPLAPLSIYQDEYIEQLLEIGYEGDHNILITHIANFIDSIRKERQERAVRQARAKK